MSNRVRSLSVSPEHFEVAPNVSGLALASPRRRTVAMLIDLAIIAAPSILIRNPIAPVGVLLAAIVYWHSRRWAGAFWKSDQGLASRRAISFAIVVVGLIAGHLWHRSHQKTVVERAVAKRAVDLAKMDAVIAALDAVPNVNPDVHRNMENVRRALSDLQPAAGEETESGEPDEIRSLRSENLALAQQVESIQRELEEERRNRGVIHFLKATARDFGIGLGWSGLYFIIFPVLWKGRTPGKRLMQIRIARVNGKPISWWNSFGRFHGYLSCLAGGLIGFLQAFWDPQSQGLHDKVAQTVVVRDVPIALPVASSEAG